MLNILHGLDAGALAVPVPLKIADNDMESGSQRTSEKYTREKLPESSLSGSLPCASHLRSRIVNKRNEAGLDAAPGSLRT